MPDLSVIIPARNEMFLQRTIEDILANIRGDTEVIAVCDGAWPDPPVMDNPRVKVIYHPVSVGQRAATNDAARMSRAKFVMKVDAHCAFDEGFDVKLMAECEPDWTVIPRMYNLHAFDWVCNDCGNRQYQGAKVCEKCKSENMTMDVIWKPRRARRTDFARFDNTLHFQYWHDYEKRIEAQGDIADTMSSVGACFFMHRDRFWELGGLDEGHGSWGQFGTEIACKSWLSGGRHVVNKRTWFAHMFRTKHKGFGFPYEISGNDQERARKYSRDFWFGDKWDKAVRPLRWIVDKFAPVPGWEEEKPVMIPTHDMIRTRFRFTGRVDNLPWITRKGGRNALAEFFKELGFIKGVEVGTKDGAYAMTLCNANPDLHLTCVDPWMEGGRRTKQDQDEHYANAVKNLTPLNVTIIRKTSMDAVGKFEDASLDFVFIDGNHEFDYAVQDIICWTKKVRKGGIVAVHDYMPLRHGGVVQAVDAYTHCHNINPWYVLWEREPTAFWVR